MAEARHSRPWFDATRCRAYGIALAAWYLLVSSYALFLAIDVFAPGEFQPEPASDCGALHVCPCSSVVHCGDHCCCGTPAAARTHGAPVATSIVTQLACGGELPLTGHALPQLSPVVLPESVTIVLPRRVAPERPAAPRAALPFLLAHAPDKVPIARPTA